MLLFQKRYLEWLLALTGRGGTACGTGADLAAGLGSLGQASPKYLKYCEDKEALATELADMDTGRRAGYRSVSMGTEAASDVPSGTVSQSKSMPRYRDSGHGSSHLQWRPASEPNEVCMLPFLAQKPHHFTGFTTMKLLATGTYALFHEYLAGSGLQHHFRLNCSAFEPSTCLSSTICIVQFCTCC